MLKSQDIFSQFGKLAVLYESDGSVVLIQRSIANQQNCVVLSAQERGIIADKINAAQKLARAKQWEIKSDQSRLQIQVTPEGAFTLSRIQGEEISMVVDELQAAIEWCQEGAEYLG